MDKILTMTSTVQDQPKLAASMRGSRKKKAVRKKKEKKEVIITPDITVEPL